MLLEIILLPQVRSLDSHRSGSNQKERETNMAPKESKTTTQLPNIKLG